MADAALWVIPAITASSGLLGTVVGGLVTYWSSARMHDRTTAADDSRRRHAQLHEGAVAFINGIAELQVGQEALERTARLWGPAGARVFSPETDDQGFMAAAREIYPGVEVGGGRLRVMLALAKETGVFDDEVRQATSLLSEIRLAAPADVAQTAQRVAYAAMAVQLTALAAPELNRHATFRYNSAVNELFNRVRHHMNVEDIDFDFVNEEVLLDVLELERDSKM